MPSVNCSTHAARGHWRGDDASVRGPCRHQRDAADKVRCLYTILLHALAAAIFLL